jgi:hypothetical protein
MHKIIASISIVTVCLPLASAPAFAWGSGSGGGGSGSGGISDYGTRLKPVFNNIPGGVSVYVPVPAYSSDKNDAAGTGSVSHKQRHPQHPSP